MPKLVAAVPFQGLDLKPSTRFLAKQLKNWSRESQVYPDSVPYHFFCDTSFVVDFSYQKYVCPTGHTTSFMCRVNTVKMRRVSLEQSQKLNSSKGPGDSD